MELFAPGNVDSMYEAEVKRCAVAQAEYIRDSLMKYVIQPSANMNVPKIRYLNIDEPHIYHENMEALRARGVRVFKYTFFWHDPTYGPNAKREKTNVRHILVWDPAIAEDFENKVLKPEVAARCPAVLDGYDFSEIGV